MQTNLRIVSDCPNQGFTNDILAGGAHQFGNVFELSPAAGSWVLTDMYDFTVPSSPVYGTPAFDAAGNFYDDTPLGGSHSDGTVLELSPSGGPWTYTDLFDFGGSSGGEPFGGIFLDACGDIYGTTYGIGNVWKLTR